MSCEDDVRELLKKSDWAGEHLQTEIALIIAHHIDRLEAKLDHELSEQNKLIQKYYRRISPADSDPNS